MVGKGSWGAWCSVAIGIRLEGRRNRLNAIKSKLLHLEAIHSLNACLKSPIVVIAELQSGMQFTAIRFFGVGRKGRKNGLAALLL